MPTYPIQLKRNGTAAATPSSLLHGEVALNYADGKLFWKDASNVIQSFTFQAYALSSHTHAASDITSGTLDAARIANDSITYAKLQNVSATDRLLGRSSAGSGDVEEITCTSTGRAIIGAASEAAARSAISVQPTASPAFTGAATVTNDGNVVPLTVTNTGTANSFVVNDASGDTSPFVIDASGAVLTGSTLTVRANSGNASHLFTYNENGGEIILYDETQTSATLFDQISTDTRLLELVNGSNLKLGLGGGNTTGSIQFMRAGYVESVVINSSGQLLVTAGSASACGVAFSGDTNTGLAQIGGADTASLVTAGVERVRVDAGGNVLINTNTGDPGGTNASGGICLAPSSYISVSRSDGASLILNRKTTDGIIAAFYQDGGLEGDIAVAGNTISYNAFCGSHWAQLIDGSRPAILRGTVLETIDEMCEWPGEPQNDRLPRVKVSDTPRSRRVYGVFMAWDEDDTATGDMYCTALGAYMVRVSGVVQSGDLLESAGDGTARTQPDDIVRSSTIGKVSSTHRVAEYDDGSYLVPCVLMCG